MVVCRERLLSRRGRSRHHSRRLYAHIKGGSITPVQKWGPMKSGINPNPMKSGVPRKVGLGLTRKAGLWGCQEKWGPVKVAASYSARLQYLFDLCMNVGR